MTNTIRKIRNVEYNFSEQIPKEATMCLYTICRKANEGLVLIENLMENLSIQRIRFFLNEPKKTTKEIWPILNISERMKIFSKILGFVFDKNEKKFCILFLLSQEIHFIEIEENSTNKAFWVERE